MFILVGKMNWIQKHFFNSLLAIHVRNQKSEEPAYQIKKAQ